MVAAQSFQRHTAMVAQLLDLITHVGDTSNLILDPDLDSYYLMDVLVVRLPFMAEDLGVLRGKGSGYAASQSMTPTQRDDMLIKQHGARETLKSIRHNMEVAFRTNESLTPQLSALVDEFVEAVEAFLGLLDKHVINAEHIDVQAGKLFASGTRTIDSGLRLYDASAPALTALLEKRIAGFNKIKYMDLAAVTACLMLALLLSYLVIRALTGPMQRAGELANAVASGDFSSEVEELHSNDELGYLLRALKTMQQNLRDSIEADRCKAAETGRIKTALDNVSGNVMVADAEGKLIYLNKAVEAMFRSAEQDVRHEVPEFSVDGLMGCELDRLYTDLSRQSDRLSLVSSTQSSEFEVGGRTFRIVANPVFNDDGERLGTAVEWTDRTEEVSVEHEVQVIVGYAQAGNLSQRVALEGKTGFFAKLGEGLNSLLEVSERVINDTVRVLSAMSKGNMTETIRADYEGTFGLLKRDANATVVKLTDVIGNIKTGSEAVSSGAEEISTGQHQP